MCAPNASLSGACGSSRGATEAQGDGQYHQRRPAHDGRDYAPQYEQQLGDNDLAKPADNDQGSQGGRPAVRHRLDAEWYGESGSEHRQHGTGPDQPHSTHLC